MTLLGCVLSPLHTKSSIFPSSSALDHVTTKEEKTLSCLHPQLTAEQCSRLPINKTHWIPQHLVPLLILAVWIRKVSRSLCHCRPFGKQILLQVVFLTPCAHDHVTTPTRGWWKITSLQATGKWMLLAVYRITQPASVPAWDGLCTSTIYYV